MAGVKVEIKPIYVLHGNDQFLLDTWRKEIVSRLVGDADPQVCVTSFDASAELAEVLDELRTLPFLAPYRVVIVRDADAFVSAHRDALENYLDRPCQSASLVLMVSSFPKNTRLYKAVAKVGQICDCSAPDRGKLGTWLSRRAGREGKTIDRDAAELLAQWMGQDLASLDSELTKLATYVGEREQITLQDVSAVVTATAGPGAFDLTNAITAGDAAGAVRALGEMLTTRGEEYKTLGMIAWHLRRALKSSQLMAAGTPAQKALPRMPGPQRTAFQGMLRRRPLSRLQKDFRQLIRADLALKTGGNPRATLQDLVISLCS